MIAVLGILMALVGGSALIYFAASDFSNCWEILSSQPQGTHCWVVPLLSGAAGIALVLFAVIVLSRGRR